MRVLRDIYSLMQAAAREFWRADPFTQAGAISYYTMLSLAPLLLLLVAIVGLVYGEQAARGEIVGRLAGLIGEDAAAVAQTLLVQAHGGGGGLLPALVGVAGLLLGATTALAQLESAIGRICGRPRQSTWWAPLRARLLALLFILLLGAAVLASLIAGSIEAALAATPGVAGPGWVWRLLDAGASFLVTTLLFAALFKLSRSGPTRWGDALFGSTAASLLFAVGRGAVAVYLGRFGIGSAYGAAGSAIALMVWINYSSLIVLFGAALAEVRGRRRRGS